MLSWWIADVAASTLVVVFAVLSATGAVPGYVASRAVSPVIVLAVGARLWQTVLAARPAIAPHDRVAVERESVPAHSGGHAR